MTRINQLPLLSTPQDGDQVPVWSTDNGDTRRLPYGDLKADILAAVQPVTNDMPSISDPPFNAVGDGVTDDTAAIQAALNTGRIFRVPATTAFYRITANLLPTAGSGLVGDGPQSIIRLTGTTTQSVIRGNGVAGVYIDNLTLDGEKATKSAGTHCLRLDNCTGWRVPRLWARDARSWAVGCYGSTGNMFGTIYSEGAQTSSGLFFDAGSDNNECTALYAKNCGGFGLQIFGSSGNRVGIVVAEDCGLEAVGINYFSNRNQVGEVYSLRSGDNGVSITGTGNQIGTVYADSPDFHGLAFYGNLNVVGTLIARNVGQAGPNYGAVAFIPAFGGQASNNTVGAVVCIDDQGVPTTTNVARALADSHTSWVTATAVGAGVYRKNAGNIYFTIAGGITGATAPTHTSGSVSDGGVLWQYVQPISNAVCNTVQNARYTPNITSPVSGTGFSQFAFAPDEYYTDIAFRDVRYIRRNTTAWAAGQSVTFGSWRANGGRVYVCSNAGGTTANAPVHASGTVTGADGVAWAFMQDGAFQPLIETTARGPRVWGGLQLTSNSLATASRSIQCGAGSPEGIATADTGSLFVRTDAAPGIECFVKATGTGATGWLPFHVRRFGSTANRPALSGSGFTGVMYFDTTLGIPIWYNGSGWVNASGGAV